MKHSTGKLHILSENAFDLFKKCRGTVICDGITTTGGGVND